MKPTFKNTTDWEKADILIQPAFIRVMDNLRKELEKTNLVATYEDIQEPFPGYQLILTKENDSVSISIWEICFQVCFTDYQFSSNNSSQASIMVEIDENLFNGDNEINWQQLEIKTQQTIQTLINNFPKI
ncbi:hypothetical protein [Crocosphaera watsonii]|uniref:Uncharacterized protein n=1 Tax=Crocosphaera watsonii WH 0401 TaxID=555881 RepID=T2JB47_CROWT|nr:hypothetical protein [Crocosphaera watsonii]CCQ62440.1 hypothetical protein CWATWH0401_487 [Crocosphaera watsonii WH 0401]